MFDARVISAWVRGATFLFPKSTVVVLLQPLARAARNARSEGTLGPVSIRVRNARPAASLAEPVLSTVTLWWVPGFTTPKRCQTGLCFSKRSPDQWPNE